MGTTRSCVLTSGWMVWPQAKPGECDFMVDADGEMLMMLSPGSTDLPTNRVKLHLFAQDFGTDDKVR